MNEDSLKRIADALEDIASMMRDRTAKQPAPIDVQRDELVELLRANAGKLIGKMEMPEIALAIGITMDPTKRRAMGTALRAYGAVRGMSKNKGYYLFPGTEGQARASGTSMDRQVLRLEAFTQKLRGKRQALTGSMTPKQVIAALGLKKLPGDEVALAAALTAEGIAYETVGDIFIFE